MLRNTAASCAITGLHWRHIAIPVDKSVRVLVPICFRRRTSFKMAEIFEGGRRHRLDEHRYHSVRAGHSGQEIACHFCTKFYLFST